MPMKYLAIDFEYNQANEPHMGLISCDLCREDGQHLSLWLKDSLVEREKLCNVLRKANDQGYTLVAHNAVAEASCLIALGLNPREFQWADTFLEYHQLQNNNNDFQYGWLISGEGPFARWIKSKPPIPRSALLESDETFGSDREKMIARFNKDGHSCEKVNPSLVHALKNILGIEADAQMKEDTRGLILERKAVYSHEEQERILAYGGTDTQHLIPLARKMRELVGGRLAKALGSRFTEDALTQAILWRGRAAANVAVYTMAGMPVDRSRWLNLAASKAAALRQAIQEFQARWCNLWEWDPREQKFKAKTSLKNGMAERIAKEHGIKWQKTGSGDFSFSTADGMPLQAYRDLIPELKDYCRLVELESGLKAHASAEEMAQEEEAGLGKKKKRRFADFFGSDNIVRPWYGPYGTQTGRNAPSATGFIPAQAGWLRGLINPPEGWEISECLAEGTQVLTKDKGFLNIESVTPQSEVWDGVQWVRHGGLVFKGVRDVHKHEGIWATGNHEFIGDDGAWHKHEELATYRRYRIPDEACSWTAIWAMVRRIGVACLRRGQQALGFNGGHSP